MIIPPEHRVRQFEPNLYKTTWNHVPSLETPAGLVSDDCRIELLARVGVLQVCICELLRKNQELRYALSDLGVTAVEDWYGTKV